MSSIVDFLLQRKKREGNEGLLEAIGDIQRACEVLGEMWKAATELENGPRLANKLNLPVLVMQCLQANGLYRVLAVASDHGAGIADIKSSAARALRIGNGGGA